MSFFKKLTNQFEELMGDKKEEKKDKPAAVQYNPARVYGQPQQHGQPQYGQQPQYNQQPQYGQQPGPQHGGQPSYGSNLSILGQQQYPTPQASQHGQLPPLPPGWIAQWDQSSNRYFYIEQATGRTQWDPPAAFHSPSPGEYAPPGVPADPGHGRSNDFYNPNANSAGAPVAGIAFAPSSADGRKGDVADKGDKKKDKKSGGNTKGMLLAGGAGLAGGALLGHALSGDSSSDDERHSGHVHDGHAEAPMANQSQPQQYNPAPPVPVADSNSSMSSSDRESLEEAREELREAQEEYEEELEDAYGSD